MCDCFSSSDIAILQTLIATAQQQQAAAAAEAVEVFRNTLAQADANLIDRTSGIAGDGDAGLVAVANAIGLPLSGYDENSANRLEGVYLGSPLPDPLSLCDRRILSVNRNSSLANEK